ncbi:MAG: 4Fe-4S binding protein [Eubacteriales bacterium]|nr:4Fe-4S binding protein [Eubacteriales bacterium]
MTGKIIFGGAGDLPISPFTKGSMVFNKTCAWRNIKPVIDINSCSKCMICWKFCPETAIDIIDGRPAIDYDYCKGCGICAAECPGKAIKMTAEEK